MLSYLLFLYAVISGVPDMTEREIFQQLKKLEVGCSKSERGVHVAASYVQTETHMPLVAQLQKLDAMHCNSSILSDQGLAYLKGHPRLRHLEILSTKVTPDGLTVLESLPNLQDLEINFQEGADTALLHVGKCKSLVSLSFRGSDLSPAGMACLKDLSHLEELEISYSSRLTSDGLTVLKNFPRLTRLVLTDCPADEASIDSILHLKNLASLSLGPNNSTDASIKKLQALRKLRLLALQGNRITEEGLRLLPPALKTLDIRQLPLNEDMLQSLLVYRDMTLLIANGDSIPDKRKMSFESQFYKDKDDDPVIVWCSKDDAKDE